IELPWFQRVTGNKGSIPEREPEKRLPHPRKAAGAQITQSDTGVQFKSLNEEQLEGKSGASSRVKKLVVELQTWPGGLPNGKYCLAGSYLLSVQSRPMPNTLAWNNKIGRIVGGISIRSSEVKFLDDRRLTTAKAFAKDVFINQERRLGDRKRSDTVVVLTVNYAD
ncbi:hypothetical protein A0H81_15018, partial [Grifola frondosa]